MAYAREEADFYLDVSVRMNKLAKGTCYKQAFHLDFVFHFAAIVANVMQ
jgi:hypothetical protein